MEATPDGNVDAVARVGARMNAERLTTESSILADAVKSQGLRIVTGFHCFETGSVEFD